MPEYLETAHEIVGFSWRFRLAHLLHRRLALESMLENVLGDRLAPRLLDVLQQRQAMTAAALEALGAQYPACAAILEKRFLKRVALRHQATEQKTLFEQVIGPELFGVLSRELQAARSGMDARPRLDLGLETRALISQVPMFAELDRKQLDAVANLLKLRSHCRVSC